MAAPPKTADAPASADAQPNSPGVAQNIPAADANGQLIVSLAIVVVLGAVALGLIIASAATKDWTFAAGAIGAIIGALATALNAPTGITSALRASAAAKAPPS